MNYCAFFYFCKPKCVISISVTFVRFDVDQIDFTYLISIFALGLELIGYAICP